MAIKLTQKGTLSLGLNPIAHTFIKFLPLSRTEFAEKIMDEIDSNPMLDLKSASQEMGSENAPLNEIEKKLERADPSFLTPWEEIGFFKPNPDKMDKNSVIETFTASKVSLSEHLLYQANLEIDPKDQHIAEYIIYNLNKDGFLDLAVESMAGSLNTTPENIEIVRNKIKQFDPVGVASRNIKECLISQLSDNGEHELLKQLIENYLEDLSEHRYDKISNELDIDNEKIIELIKELRRLNPKPASSFDPPDIDYADVDLLLIKDGDEYKVRYIEEGIPQLVLSQYYDEMLDKNVDKKTNSYLKERQRNANLFIEGVALRKTIIEKIAEHLIKVQKDFLNFGEKWKKPLTMKDVANELGYNESTISRAVNNKFMASENGLISLKTFFSHGLKGEFGFVHSSETIKDKIKNIIEKEDKMKPISDQEISDRLSEIGIKIARRTIRNYRDEMNILSSSKRKQEYKLKGV